MLTRRQNKLKPLVIRVGFGLINHLKSAIAETAEKGYSFDHYRTGQLHSVLKRGESKRENILKQIRGFLNPELQEVKAKDSADKISQEKVVPKFISDMAKSFGLDLDIGVLGQLDMFLRMEEQLYDIHHLKRTLTFERDMIVKKYNIKTTQHDKLQEILENSAAQLREKGGDSFEMIFSDLVLNSAKNHPDPDNPSKIKEFLHSLASAGIVSSQQAEKAYDEYFSPKVFVTFKYNHPDQTVLELCHKKTDVLRELQLEMEKKMKGMVFATGGDDFWVYRYGLAAENMYDLAFGFEQVCGPAKTDSSVNGLVPK